jgi:type IV secretory pathway TrbL component
VQAVVVGIGKQFLTRSREVFSARTKVLMLVVLHEVALMLLLMKMLLMLTDTDAPDDWFARAGVVPGAAVVVTVPVPAATAASPAATGRAAALVPAAAPAVQPPLWVEVLVLFGVLLQLIPAPSGRGWRFSESGPGWIFFISIF